MYWSRGLFLWMVQRKCRCRNLKRVDGTTQEFVSGAFTKTSIKSPTRLLTQRLRHCRLCLRRAYVDSPYAMSLRKLTRLRVSLTQAASLLWHSSFNSRAREVSKMLHWCIWKSTSSALPKPSSNESVEFFESFESQLKTSKQVEHFNVDCFDWRGQRRASSGNLATLRIQISRQWFTNIERL